VSDVGGHLDWEVEWARRKLANLDQRRDLDHERDGNHWALVNEAGLTARQAAEQIRDRLLSEGFTDEQIRALGVSEASIKPVARLRSRP
jgi:hypothetical protein